MLWQLTQQAPALTLMAVSRARLTFSVQTLEPSPNFVLLAKAMASLGVLNVNTVKTGPKIWREMEGEGGRGGQGGE